MGHGYRSQDVLDVVWSKQRAGEGPERLAMMVHSDVGAGCICLPRHRLPLGTGFQTIGLDRRRAGHRGQQLADMRGIMAGNEAAIRREERDETGKSRTHVVQVTVDVGMIELDGRQDRGAWTVVQEFWAFVEIGAVVLIAFDHKVRPLPQTKRPINIAHYGPHKKARLIASML